MLLFSVNASVVFPSVGHCFCYQLSLFFLLSIPGLSTLLLMRADSLTAVCRARNKKGSKTKVTVLALIPCWEKWRLGTEVTACKEKTYSCLFRDWGW